LPSTLFESFTTTIVHRPGSENIW